MITDARGSDKVDLNTIMAGLNSFVHVAMYTYYLLANMGPRMRRYLWWKSHLTKLQIVHGAVSVDTYLKSLPSIYSPPMVPVIVAIYLSLVLVILPWYMAHRQPYKLQTFLHLYNVGQIMMNIGLCYMYTELMNYQPLKVWDNICAFVTSTNGANDDWVYLKLQFLLALTLLGRLQMEGCKQASHYAVMWGFTVATVLFLFCDFYKKAYIKKTA
uniref:Elongation of very long chain fatty acids protein n=1 Tax=Rhodnius prolixus TaxID=13249 RepID=T1H7M4_RHOPR